ncbi:MAG: cation transporter [Clostridia bacterium]|nr:cation transporter [Clostridia bacterium]
MSNETKRISVGKRYSVAGICANLFLFIIKLTASILSGSLSAIADSLNNLSDASASIVSLIGFRLSEKRADSEHPYGHARAEYLSALIVAMFTVFIGFELVKTSVSEIINPSSLTLSPTVFCIMGLSVIIKFVMAVLNRATGKKINSGTLIATAADSRNDAVITTGVIIGYIVSSRIGYSVDGYVSLVVAIFICASGIMLTKSTLDPLLGKAPDKELVDYIQTKILSYPAVLGAHDLIIHDYGHHKRFASVHVEMAAEQDSLTSHDIIDVIEEDFLSSDNINMIIHLDPIETDDSTRSLRRIVLNVAKKLHPDCTIHDLKVKDDTVSFDCIKPDDCNLSEEAFITAFTVALQMVIPEYSVRIKIDSSFSPIIK